MIIYFSGTGNSKYCADMLSDLLNEKVLNSAEYTRVNKAATIENEDRLIIVCPCHVASIPKAFIKFLNESNFINCKKVWCIVTCASTIGAAPYFLEKICKQKKLEYMGTLKLLMPQNYIIIFKPDSYNKALKIIENAKPTIQDFAKSIENDEKFNTIAPSSYEIKSTKLVYNPYYKLFVKPKKFYATDKCIGCGKCERICPTANITMENNKPKWGKNCIHCMGCFGGCPTKSIEYGKLTQNIERYFAPGYKKSN